MNQLEKLESAKAALLVCLSSLSLTGSFLLLLGPSGSIFTDITGSDPSVEFSTLFF